MLNCLKISNEPDELFSSSQGQVKSFHIFKIVRLAKRVLSKFDKVVVLFLGFLAELTKSINLRISHVRDYNDIFLNSLEILG